jgi:two-component system LytT family response regulator
MNTAIPEIRQHPSDVLLLPVSPETLCIPLDSIIRIEASSNYSKVFCKDQSFPIVAAKVLRWFEERLPQQVFVRVHRTHLVNKKYVVAIRNNNVLLESGMQISISRRKRKKCFPHLQANIILL